MKKVYVWFMAMWMGMGTVAYAQDNQSENRTQMRAEMVKKQAEQQAKDMGLGGDVKDNFIVLYCQYQNDLMRRFNMPEDRQTETEEKKTLTDEEANAQVDAFFARQEEMVVQMQKRLQVQKAYRTEFAKILTPQQLAKLYSHSRGDRSRMGERGRGQWGGTRAGMARPGGFGGPF